MSDTSSWRPGVITITCLGGNCALPGWISEPFGIDWGVHNETGDILWVVHHLPTGFNLCAVDRGVEDVKQFVDLLRALGDWEFTDPAGAEYFKDALNVARASGFVVHNPAHVGRPTYPDCVVVPAA